MAASGTGDLRNGIERLLREHPGQTARQLTSRLQRLGHTVDKSRVNRVLYRHSDVFANDAAVPPTWSLASAAPKDLERAPHRLAGVRLRNWKAFEVVTVPVADITLLYGENSSGKSSIIQALLLMELSWLHGDLQFGSRHGWFEHVVHRHDAGRSIELQALWGSSDRGQDPIWMVGMTAHGDGGYDFNPEHAIARFTLVLGADMIVMDRQDEEPGDTLPQWTAGIASVEEADPASTLMTARFHSNAQGFPDLDRSIAVRDAAGSAVGDMVTTLHRIRAVIDGASALFGGLLHIGPYRWVPERDLEMGRVMARGDYIARLHADPDLVTEVNEWLVRFEVPYDLEIVRYGGTGDEASFELVLRRGASGERVQLIDVGFGIGQLLPIITQLLGSREKTILLEEPEAHVHPRLQSTLAELFVVSSQDYGNRLVVETHSEPILLRLQRQIAEGRVANEEICVVHVERDGLSSRVTEVGIKDNGHLDYTWPGGFFDDRMDDLVAILDPRPED